jgi:hypothetical protein
MTFRAHAVDERSEEMACERSERTMTFRAPAVDERSEEMA